MFDGISDEVVASKFQSDSSSTNGQHGGRETCAACRRIQCRHALAQDVAAQVGALVDATRWCRPSTVVVQCMYGDILRNRRVINKQQQHQQPAATCRPRARDHEHEHDCDHDHANDHECEHAYMAVLRACALFCFVCTVLPFYHCVHVLPQSPR